MATPRDFCFWLRGLLVGRDRLDHQDVVNVHKALDDVLRGLPAEVVPCPPIPRGVVPGSVGAVAESELNPLGDEYEVVANPAMNGRLEMRPVTRAAAANAERMNKTLGDIVSHLDEGGR